ncbi:MAG: GH92 family glycosyl hydrolase, partial [Pyrinomonadaceae bacterium]
AWNKELSKIEVSGGTEAEMTNFYTALYHTAIQPNIFEDVDGNYRGLDKKIHNIADGQNPKSKIQNPKSNYYTVFSLWDTFRAAHPLYTIVDQKRTVDYINTFIRQYEQGGRLPVWELAGNETDTMIGYHAVSVIADAMAKNITGFDYEKAFAAAKHSAELNHFGLESYKKRGYISMEDEQESVSKTLEYSYNDFCIAQMAKILERQNLSAVKSSQDAQKGGSYFRDYQKYIRRARYFENLFDAETGFMRPKQNGSFIKPFAPNDVTFHFTEGNSWQYSFFVPHDVSRLIELHGGNVKFTKKLDELFTTESKLSGREQPDITGLIGQYAHGNEPSHHIAYLYNYAGAPHKTQKIVRHIMDEFYKPTPDGLIGNEDCGQMSAWYILSALGFYQVNPSQAVYAIGSPIFPEAKINLENGKSFIIKTANVSASNLYIKSAKLGGVNHRKSFITHDELMRGGVLEFSMTDVPNEDWFTEFPISKIEENLVAVPLIEAAGRVFKNQNAINLKTTTQGAKILYSIDGSEPKLEYSKPFTLDETAIVKAVSINSDGEKSLIAEAKFFKKPNDWTVKILAKYNRQYTGGGDEGLIDGIRGTTNFASGEWQGYPNQDFVAVIDLPKETTITKLGGGFLQDARPWIWMPTRIEFEVSDDGENFQTVAEIKTDVAPEDMKPQIKDYLQNIAPVKARYVRVKAINLGKIPAWHPGAGFDAFIFVDEIFIR